MSLILVTGGAGFIGSHLTEALLSLGHQVRVLDDLSTGKRANLNPACELVVADAADTAATRAAMAGASCCFHLAAIASVQRGNEDWLGTHRANQTASIAVFDAARDAGRIPVIYASSAAVYGDLAGEVATEASTTRPSTAYGADKLGTELHGRVAWGVHGVPNAGLRFFNVYGPRQDPASPYSGVISIFAARLAAGLPITLHGDGGQTRDFIEVSDVVAHLLAAQRLLAANPQAAIFNVCTGRETSIRALAEILARACGVDAAPLSGPARAGDIRRSAGSPTLAQAQLGLSAQVALAAGLQNLLAWQAQAR